MTIIALGIIGTSTCRAQPYVGGDIIPNQHFEIRGTDTTATLKDYTGQIVILAFFTEWCRNCRTALESIRQELETRTNPNDIPISLIAVNLDSENPERIDQFITDNSLDIVINDFELQIWDLYAESNSIPLLVVINGVRNSSTHRHWQVIHKQVGLPEQDSFFEAIDTVQLSKETSNRENPFSELGSNGFDWRESPWFGRFNDQYFPWIYHEQHEWLYVDRSSDAGKQITAYDNTLGWLKFTKEDQEHIFAFTRNTWMQYDADQTGLRHFYDHSAEVWLPFPTEREAQPGGRNGFIYSNAQIPVSEIHSGGPPRDGIPAILEPQFVSQEMAAEYMKDDDVVISVSHLGETRAYPFRILNWHEIVNDQIDDLHFAATYCPLCGTAIVFNRTVNDRILTFGVSGLLYLDNVLMYDHQSESLWSQLFLQGVTGPQFGTPLRFVPSQQILYGAWKTNNPEGTVLSTATGHSRDYSVDPYANYFRDPDPLFPVGDIRNDLEPKAWVFGALVDGSPIAFARDQLPSGQTFQHSVNGIPLSVFYDDSSQNIQVTYRETGQPVTGLWSFWFAWQAFHPQTDLWIGDTE